MMNTTLQTSDLQEYKVQADLHIITSVKLEFH